MPSPAAEHVEKKVEVGELSTRAEEEAEFEKTVKELAEGFTGLKGGFVWMTWVEGDEKGRQAVVWMHGNFTGGRCYTVRAAGGSGVVMRVEREDGRAGSAVEHVEKKQKK